MDIYGLLHIKDVNKRFH